MKEKFILGILFCALVVGALSFKTYQSPIEIKKETVGMSEVSSLESSTSSDTSSNTSSIVAPLVSTGTVAKTDSPSELKMKSVIQDSGVRLVTPSLLPKSATSSESVSTSIAATTTVIAPPLPPEQTIDPQSILGIVCDYDYTFANPLTGDPVQGKTEQKGSGVIIDPRGYVITNRHVLERQDENANLEMNGKNYQVTLHFTLRGCRAGRVIKGTSLPTKEEILAFNPLTQVPVIGYTLRTIYVRDRSGMSEDESFIADFALLQISGLTPEAPTFGISAMPATFEYAKMLPLKDLQIPNKEVFTYGFPGDVTEGKQSDFETLYFTGSVGRITEIAGGDQYYKDTPLSIATKMEIYHGRSGSPLFWRGYVIGLVTALDSRDRTNSYSVASDVILRDIKSYLN